MTTLKKDSLLKGTIILALAALVARVLGMFQKIPLEYMLDAEGQFAFFAANQIYLLLLVVATAGFPSAISKMVSERMEEGNYEDAKRIYKASLVFGAVTGLLLALTLYIMAPMYAATIVKKESVTLAVQAIAPALILFPIIAMMRGYFQGRQMMTAGGLSQIVEQFARVILGLGLGYIFVSLGYSDEASAAAVTFGSVFGSIAAFIVMVVYARKLKKQDDRLTKTMSAEARLALMPNKPFVAKRGEKLKFRTIYKEILSMSIPALITSMTINLVYTFDSSFFVRITERIYTELQATEAAAVLGIKAQSLAGIPPILAIALGSSIIPIVAAAFARKDQAEVNRQSSMVMKIVCVSGVPVAMFFTASAFSITGLLFSSPGGYETVAMLCAGTILQITMMTTNSILYGMGKQRQTMVNTISGLLGKVVVSWICGYYFGVAGFVIGSTVCFLMVTLMNLRLIKRDVTLHVMGKKWLPYIAAVIISTLACWGAEYVMLSITEGMADKLAYLLAVLVSGSILCGIYGILLLKLKVITQQDVESLPGKLRGPMKKLMRVVRAG
ncbi:stage V sporulation protein B [Paenibacillus montaniterrae]|uniref:Stage V sporulation protein B n=1 Tax=Paenibacillus montaniterrae TaxID=429341 RepID=A0A919YP63_9BACL|nr:polysaccharide biosynthesis protein [Paenibacillus montaniterrae]GIP15709.1 stage V sporulation protein B [Paenibacillus montaniterrae]